MIVIGHSSPAFCHDLIDETAHRVADAGFDAWEIVGEGGHDPWVHRREFRNVLASHDLLVQLHAPLSDANLGSLVPEFWGQAVKTVERAMRGAAAIGARRVTVHPGNHTPLSRGHYSEMHEATRRALRRLDRAREEFGVDLLLENMAPGWAFETASLAQLRDLTRGTGLGICFDVGHAHVAKRIPEFVRAARKIGNVHIHDNRGDVDSHLVLGEGTLPWERTARGLVKGGYQGAVVIESHSHAEGRRSLHALRKVLRG